MNSDSSSGSIRQHQFLFQLLAAVFLLNAVVVLMLGISLHQAHQNYEDRAKDQAQNVVQLLARQVDATLDKSQMALLAARDLIQDGLVRHDSMGQLIPRILARQQQHLPEVSAVRFDDANGIVRYGTNMLPGSQSNISQRDYFKTHRDHDGAGILISQPIRGQITGSWMTVISLRCNRPDGSFYGLVTANIYTRKFSELFQNLNLGQKGIAVLRDRNAYIIARYPMPDGLEYQESRNVSGHLANQLKINPDHGIYLAHSSVDNILRYYAYKQAGLYPGYVMVGISEEEAMAPWRHQYKLYLLLGGLFFILTTSVAFLLDRSWRRQRAIALALSQEKQHFHIIADYIHDWDYWLAPDGRLLFISQSCLQVTGYSTDEFILDPELLLTVVHPDDRPAIAGLRETPCDENTLEHRIVRKDGEIRWIARTCRAVYGNQGEFMGRRVSNRDISGKVQSMEQLRTLARTDGLTGLANRRCFDETAQEEFLRFQRYGSPTSVLILDIDHFKRTNDRYGHLAGDDALTLLATVLKDNTRACDMVARWGGEEFLILLPDTPLEHTGELAERIRLSAYELAIPSSIGNFHITVSIGCTEFRPGDHAWVDALARADHALYRAKQMGRNRIILSSAS